MEVLILTGACGVGKSTLAKTWAKSKQGAIIECDCFTNWIYKTDFPHWTNEEEDFTSKLTALNVFEYLKLGMPVAVDNLWTPYGLNLLVNYLKEARLPIKIKAIFLYCDLQENHRRDQLRIPEHQMKERINVVSKELKEADWPDYVYQLDTTNLKLENVLEQVNNNEFI